MFPITWLRHKPITIRYVVTVVYDEWARHWQKTSSIWHLNIHINYIYIYMRCWNGSYQNLPRKVQTKWSFGRCFEHGKHLELHATRCVGRHFPGLQEVLHQRRETRSSCPWVCAHTSILNRYFWYRKIWNESYATYHSCSLWSVIYTNIIQIFHYL